MDDESKKAWFQKEFEKIKDLIKDEDSLSHYNFLRIRNYKLNTITTEPEENIPVKTKKAFELAKKGEIKNAIEELISINEVGIPIASAILAMRFPEEYAIIDKNVIEELGKNEWLKSYKNSPETYLKYLELLRKKAEENGMCLRDYERSLFEKHKWGT